MLVADPRMTIEGITEDLQTQGIPAGNISTTNLDLITLTLYLDTIFYLMFSYLSINSRENYCWTFGCSNKVRNILT